MTSAQDKTLAQYQGLMQVNASSHLLRAARNVGVIAELRDGQRTLEQLIEGRDLVPDSTMLLLDGLIAIGIVEKYEEDFALSRAGHLLCQYDEDLGDQLWQRLTNLVSGKTERDSSDDQLHSNYLAATQWVHTASAMQAAEILDIGGDSQPQGLKILDLGGGSGVWSCAMAHRDPQSTLVMADLPEALVAANAMAKSIGLEDRVSKIEGDPDQVELPSAAFDLALIAQQTSLRSDDQANALIRRAIDAVLPGGQVVIVDLFRSTGTPNLAESIEALKLDLGTRRGRVRDLREIQVQMTQCGLENVQFTYLAASRVNLGMAVGRKPK